MKMENGGGEIGNIGDKKCLICWNIIGMRGKEYISFLNIAGAICSILALLLTLSRNVTIALVLKSLVAIVFFIATAGTLGNFAYSLNTKIIKTDYWPYHLLYWLVLGMAIIWMSYMISSLGYIFTSGLIQLFTGSIDDI